jgi:hypothetical protein
VGDVGAAGAGAGGNAVRGQSQRAGVDRSPDSSRAARPVKYFLKIMEVTVFLVAFFVLLVLWALGFLAFHIAGGLIHLLVVLAVISLIVHLFRGRTT